MNANYHPFHYSPIVDLNSLPIDEAVTLMRAWTKDKPRVEIQGAPVFFTNSWIAAQFLSTLGTSEESFDTLVYALDNVVRLVASESATLLAIDPCPACGWYELIDLSKNNPRQAFELLSGKILELRERAKRLRDRCRLLIDRQNYEDAFEILLNLTSHLNRGDAEAHFLLGQCALKLNDAAAYDTAIDNLKNIDPTFLAKLLAIK